MTEQAERREQLAQGAERVYERLRERDASESAGSLFDPSNDPDETDKLLLWCLTCNVDLALGGQNGLMAPSDIQQHVLATGHETYRVWQV